MLLIEKNLVYFYVSFILLYFHTIFYLEVSDEEDIDDDGADISDFDDERASAGNDENISAVIGSLISSTTGELPISVGTSKDTIQTNISSMIQNQNSDEEQGEEDEPVDEPVDDPIALSKSIIILKLFSLDF